MTRRSKHLQDLRRRLYYRYCSDACGERAQQRSRSQVSEVDEAKVALRTEIRRLQRRLRK